VFTFYLSLIVKYDWQMVRSERDGDTAALAIIEDRSMADYFQKLDTCTIRRRHAGKDSK
jgi:hypothetical protein